MPRPAMAFIVLRSQFIWIQHSTSWAELVWWILFHVPMNLRRLSDSNRCRDLEDSLLSACAGKDLHTRGKTSIDEGRGYTGLNKMVHSKGKALPRMKVLDCYRCSMSIRKSIDTCRNLLSARAGKDLYPWQVVKSISQIPIPPENSSRNRWSV